MGDLHPDIRLLFPAIQASASAPAPAGGYPSAAAGIRAVILGYPDTRQQFAEKGPSAPAGGYPLALAGIRQRIAGIRDGYPSTISRNQFLRHHWSFCP
ncbi:hypothetical protein PGT21_017149 [Puccinia graminis f. sp. tritici]|uniref:Uncharacterized protein n=1 Tax=Puccinia graminis f. sp. tritici TaxID=56615 RepID=A0A5B0M4J1_PUCGR|nr:hypothetical protein PGT21_017149 [Puccinia graminis f. sp. tritici]